MTSPLQAQAVPHIVTELPGPKARAHVEFDHAWTIPSLPRAYPIVPVRGLGCALEDIDGNVFLDFAAGIAVNSTGHSHPRRRDGDPGPGGELLHFSASDFYLPDLRAGRRRARADLADSAARPARSSATAAPRRSRPALKLARYAHASPERHRVPRGVPRPDLWARSASRRPRRSTTRTSARCCPASTTCRSATRASRRSRGPDLQAPDARRRVRGDHRRADPGRGRLRRPRGRLPAAPARAVRPPRDPAHRRRGPVRAPAAPARCGRSSTGTSSPTSCSRRRASRRACRSAR